MRRWVVHNLLDDSGFRPESEPIRHGVFHYRLTPFVGSRKEFDWIHESVIVQALNIALLDPPNHPKPFKDIVELLDGTLSQSVYFHRFRCSVVENYLSAIRLGNTSYV